MAFILAAVHCSERVRILKCLYGPASAQRMRESFFVTQSSISATESAVGCPAGLYMRSATGQASRCRLDKLGNFVRKCESTEGCVGVFCEC